MAGPPGTEGVGVSDDDKERLNRLNQQLTRVSATRIETNRSVWTVFSIFLGASAVLVSAVATNKAPETRVWLSGIGFFAAVVWAAFLSRAISHLDFNEHLMHELEEAIGVESQFSILYSRNPDGFRKLVNEGYPRPIRPEMVRLACAIGLAWFIAALYFGLAIRG